MKNPLVIFVLIVLASWYAFGVFMKISFGGKWSDALLWPVSAIKGRLAPPADDSLRAGPSLTNADGLPAGSMSLT